MHNRRRRQLLTRISLVLALSAAAAWGAQCTGRSSRNGGGHGSGGSGDGGGEGEGEGAHAKGEGEGEGGPMEGEGEGGPMEGEGEGAQEGEGEGAQEGEGEDGEGEEGEGEEGEGEGDPPGCDGNDDCPRGQFCDCEAGVCGGNGECAERPRGCNRLFDPVCGCDEQTYGNDCNRRNAGVCLLHEGECAEPGGCDANDDCAENEYCECGDGCGTMGECAARPDICIRIFDPVCGCDGQTHGNSCVAASAGTCIRHDGECNNRDR